MAECLHLEQEKYKPLGLYTRHILELWRATSIELG